MRRKKTKRVAVDADGMATRKKKIVNVMKGVKHPIMMMTMSMIQKQGMKMKMNMRTTVAIEC